MPLLLTDRAVPVSPLTLFTPDECRMLGIPFSPKTLHRVRKGVYVDRTQYEKLPPWSKYAVRVHAFALKHPDAVLAFESAAIVHGMPQFGETLDIHVFDPDRDRSRRFGDVIVHTSADSRELTRVHGLQVTSMLDTAVDLGRVLPLARSLAVMDAVISAAQGGPLTLDQLRDHAESQQSARGRRLLRWLFSRADGAAESPAESVSRAVIEWCGFETPSLQKEFRYEDSLDRTDFFFPSSGTIGEADGWQKYKLDDLAEATRRLAEEKRREDRLRRNGHPFARWDLADAWKVTPLVKALLAAGAKRIAHPQQTTLASLRRTSRDLTASRRGETPSRA